MNVVTTLGRTSTIIVTILGRTLTSILGGWKGVTTFGRALK